MTPRMTMWCERTVPAKTTCCEVLLAIVPRYSVSAARAITNSDSYATGMRVEKRVQ
jgi:hypothetical protein